MNLKHPLILASSSPRRQFLMREIGFQFEVAVPGTDESFPSSMAPELVPAYLAEKKAAVFRTNLANEIILTSDTVVILEGAILNKPFDRDEAIDMLERLSGRTHTVITAVCLMARTKTDCFEDRALVTFKRLSDSAIEHYVDTAKPFDKAGAYGAQECLPAGLNPCSTDEVEFLAGIGKLDLIAKSISPAGSRMIAIESIEGSYFTVMGLPIHKVYSHLGGF